MMIGVDWATFNKCLAGDFPDRAFEDGWETDFGGNVIAGPITGGGKAVGHWGPGPRETHYTLPRWGVLAWDVHAEPCAICGGFGGATGAGHDHGFDGPCHSGPVMEAK